MPPPKNPDFITDLVRRFDQLSDDHVVPVQVPAALHSISDKTVIKSYPTVRLSAGRIGVRVGTIRAISRAGKQVT